MPALMNTNFNVRASQQDEHTEAVHLLFVLKLFTCSSQTELYQKACLKIQVHNTRV